MTTINYETAMCIMKVLNRGPQNRNKRGFGLLKQQLQISLWPGMHVSKFYSFNMLKWGRTHKIKFLFDKEAFESK